MDYEPAAVTMKIYGKRNVVVKTIDKIKELMQVIHTSDLRPSDGKDEVHVFLTILEEVDK